ncbi:MAG: hypothetical protein KUG82_16740 [Pseudomonadales bacterium]|nr:hypothetical protein [Pseudomonadales bacterium]
MSQRYDEQRQTQSGKTLKSSPPKSSLENTHHVNKQKRNSDYYYRQMNSAIEDSFSYEQKKEIRKILTRCIRVPSSKLVSIEVTFWFFRYFYLVFYLGHDNRRGNRKFEETSVWMLIRLLMTGGIYLLLWGSTLVVVFAVLYYAKSILEINIMPFQHLQDLFSAVVLDNYFLGC